jgi:hypothetical protein
MIRSSGIEPLPSSPCHKRVVHQCDIRYTLACSGTVNPGLTAIIEGNQVIVHYPLLQDGSQPISVLGVIPEGRMCIEVAPKEELGSWYPNCPWIETKLTSLPDVKVSDNKLTPSPSLYFYSKDL